MIERIECVFGVARTLGLEDRYAPGCEIEALEFLNALPLDWRLVFENGTSTGWIPGARVGMHEALRGFHDLQRPVKGGTSGTLAYKVTLETRGIGDTLVLMWLRDGKCRPAKPVLKVILEGCEV